MDHFYEARTIRNKGIIPAEHQEILSRSTIAIAGCGAGGGAAAVSLARMGIRSFRLADPDIVEESNINRQEGAFTSTVGQNKAETIKKAILDIDPQATVTLYTEGIHSQNVDSFLKDSDLLLEEIDYLAPSYTLLAHEAARRHGIPIFTAIPVIWNAFLFHFVPDGITYEQYTKTEHLEPKDIKSADVAVSAYVPEPPPYLSEELIRDILSEKTDIPAVDSGVKMAAAMLSSHCYFFLCKVKKILPVPHYYSANDLLLLEPRKLEERRIEEVDNILTNQ